MLHLLSSDMKYMYNQTAVQALNAAVCTRWSCIIFIQKFVRQRLRREQALSISPIYAMHACMQKLSSWKNVYVIVGGGFRSFQADMLYLCPSLAL